MVHKGKEKKNKHKRRISCEQNKTRDIPIIVEEERWDAYWDIPKIGCLRLIEILSWGELGIPNLELLCLLNSSHITVSLNLKSFINTKLNKDSWDKLV